MDSENAGYLDINFLYFCLPIPNIRHYQIIENPLYTYQRKSEKNAPSL